MQCTCNSNKASTLTFQRTHLYNGRLTQWQVHPIAYLHNGRATQWHRTNWQNPEMSYFHPTEEPWNGGYTGWQFQLAREFCGGSTTHWLISVCQEEVHHIPTHVSQRQTMWPNLPLVWGSTFTHRGPRVSRTMRAHTSKPPTKVQLVRNQRILWVLALNHSSVWDPAFRGISKI